MNQITSNTNGTGSSTITINGNASTGISIGVSSGGTVQNSATQSSTVENAVYAYLQAMRGLGHTRVNTDDVAKALGLTPAVVESTLGSLQKKGVKVA